MPQFIQWARGSASKETKRVGPHHDPYGRDIVTVTLDGKVYQIVSCGLVGEYLRLPGGDEIHLAETGHISPSPRNRKNYEAEVIRHTGFDSMYWLHKLWMKLDAARHRDPEAYDLQERINDACDRAYGGYM